MNKAKRLSLEEIISLPKASVIWRGEHSIDEESGCFHYEVEPMLICIPGENGVLAWADRDSSMSIDINEKLITEDRFFWDSEPTKEQITKGVPVQETDRFFAEYDYREFSKTRLLPLITYYKFSLPSFCEASGIEFNRMIEILKSGVIDVDEIWKISKTLNISIDEIYDFLRPGNNLHLVK